MRKRKQIYICAAVLGVVSAASLGVLYAAKFRQAAVVSGESVTFTFNESREAFQNPMKGFRPLRVLDGASFSEHEYASVYKQYIKYTDLESSESDTVQKIIDWSNREWAGIEKRNIKVIPRVVIVYPNGPGGGDYGYWPDGFGGGDMAERWQADGLKERLAAFIYKLGEAWDNDPRVAAVEVGLWGNWGEHHIHPLQLYGNDQIPRDWQTALGDAFTTAFKNKKFMVRYPKTFKKYDVGFFWDSFGMPEDESSGVFILARDNWQRQMIGGEVAYDWGDRTLFGNSPNETLMRGDATDYIVGWVNKVHASSLGWVSEYNQNDKNLSENAKKLQKALGYRYVIREAETQRGVYPGDTLPLTFVVENIGAAPFYYDWPVEARLLDAEHNPVWKQVIETDIREWLPGGSYTVSTQLAIPSDIVKGTYTLALTVLDPSGETPALRFANENYYRGGYTPLCRIGIGHDAADDDLEPFDSLYDDHSLSYVLQ